VREVAHQRAASHAAHLSQPDSFFGKTSEISKLAFSAGLALLSQYERACRLPKIRRGTQEERDIMVVAAALVSVAVTVSSLAPAASQTQVSIPTVSFAALTAPEPATYDQASLKGLDRIGDLRKASLKAPSQLARPSALVPLYASFAALQGFDIFTTSKAVARGADEANPLMKPVAGKSMASVVVKAAATAGSIYFTERAWKQNRKGAVILMTALNVATAAIVAHNTQVARQQVR
jgi:hypothetical protein